MTTFLILLVLYFLPTIMAPRGRRDVVFVWNLILGITGIGWVLMLAMSIWVRLGAKEQSKSA